MSKKSGGVAGSYVDGFFVKSDEVAAKGTKLQPKEISRGALKCAFFVCGNDKPITMKPHHIALKVRDLEKCERFYRDVIGLSVVTHQTEANGKPRSVWLKTGETILMLELCSGPALSNETTKQTEKSGWHLFAMGIKRNERDSWKKRLSENGITITNESEHSIYFDDPEGNHLALSHYKL